jgi:hypothetical protein
LKIYKKYGLNKIIRIVNLKYFKLKCHKIFIVWN